MSRGINTLPESLYKCNVRKLDMTRPCAICVQALIFINVEPYSFSGAEAKVEQGLVEFGTGGMTS